jgi:hypothetical protein
MKLPCLLGILSFALITQASGAGLSLSPSSASVDPNGGTYSFFVNESHSSFGGNDDWYWIREASWVSPQESTNQDGDQTFTYIVAPNPSISSRSTRIRMVKDGGAFNSDVTRYRTITQAGLVPTLSLSSSSRTFSSHGGGGSFSVSSNTGWRWSGKPSWVTTNESSGQNGNQLFSYSVQSNTSTSSRSATLSFITTSGGNAVARTHRINQEGTPDTVPPVITRIGPPTSTIEANRIANYIDAGATCLDEVDGVLRHAVEVSGQVVNLRHPGTYIIRYNCEDSSGNEADEVIRTVTVKDTLPPVITLAGDDTMTTEASFLYQEPVPKTRSMAMSMSAWMIQAWIPASWEATRSPTPQPMRQAM